MACINIDRLKIFFLPHGLLYTFLSIIIVCLLILTIIYASLYRNSNTSPNISPVANGIIGYPIRLPNDGRYIQWIFLQMNDVYELIPLQGGRRGGFARVAYMRQLLKQENSNTYTILAGDFLSPSVLSLAKVNGTTFNGKHMVATMNTVGVDFVTFGNHEFDLSEKDLLTRMNESTFTWISSNIFRQDSYQTFGSSISHKIITIDTIRILFIGLTIEKAADYVRIINQSSLVNHVKEFLRLFPNGTYDILVAITHLSITTDIQLALNIPQIDLIIGGHEHENYYYLRGTKYIPIYKADINAFTVYIHRCAYNLDKKHLRIYSTLAPVTSEIPEEKNTATVANYWFNLGIQGFQVLGYEPNEIVSCLPLDIELDGRARSCKSFVTLLTAAICESLLLLTVSNKTTIGIINGGTLVFNDILREIITQYDVLRTVSVKLRAIALSVPGQLLAQVLTTGMSLKGNGMFLAYTRVKTFDNGKTWLLNGTDISKSDLYYNVATIAYVRDNTQLNNPTVTTLYESSVPVAKGLIKYLKIKYPCWKKKDFIFKS
ncbi:unnamed protein product [Rotaria sordida]|uniref:5'-nucleotidase n=1 Tax=Rotaria sordida TaxID=392033 RepID=A0A819MNQ6_9BILA|nr:unnamed protein product [Rotaria sordida]